MKKLMMIAGGMLAAVLPLMAETEKVGDYTWTYRINGGTAEIYKGSFSAAISPNPANAVTIPSTLGGKPVTSIGAGAFCDCSGLTSVTIPSSVTSIGARAFRDCSGLTSVTIPSGVTSIGEGAFSGCSGLTSVTIPSSVTNIESFAFRGCSGLMSIAVADGNANYSSANGLLLSKDGKTLIQGVNGNVMIPSSVTSIWCGAFYGCRGLMSVTIPSSVTSIGDCAFYSCSGLTSVTFQGNAPEIEEDTFSGVNSDCVVYVSLGSSGWGVAIPGIWMRIEYIP